MNESDEKESAVSVSQSDDETLARLSGAVGQPPVGVLENAKALFALIHEGKDAADTDSVPAVSASAGPAHQGRG